MLRVNAVSETIIVEEPDCQDVLGVVPNIKDEPSVADVVDEKIAASEDRQV